MSDYVLDPFWRQSQPNMPESWMGLEGAQRMTLKAQPVFLGPDAKHHGGAVRGRCCIVKAPLLFFFWEENGIF